MLAEYGVEMIGASRDAIDMAEDRDRFRRAMDDIGLESPRARLAHGMEEAWEVQKEIGFPAIIRPSFTLGGSGGGIAYNRDEFEEICDRGIDLSPTNEVQIEESVLGWKEYEMEVVRDHRDNCIIICSIENLDARGEHTGDSATVAPAQTLTDKEYQIMRDASIRVLRKIGVETGGSNVQFAVNPDNGRLVVIEMNPRVSRSSALASKATGFPIAKVAAKLAVGYTLDELRNEITGGVTPASFEPTIDYVVTKLPRFTFEKFPQAQPRLTTQMKSVGEAMAIGRSFPESFQKALRSLEIGRDGLNPRVTGEDEEAREAVEQELRNPGPERLWYIGDAFRQGREVDEVARLTGLDPWFLIQIQDLVAEEQALEGMGLAALDHEQLARLKAKGFADSRLASLLGTDETSVRGRRRELEVAPVYKRVDSCAAEFEATTAYMYSSYEEECESRPSRERKILILGSGPNRIGQGIEFDYCCVHAALALREDGYETIMVNCNPETVSTDYDTSDRLYFEPLTLEDVLEIVERERPEGVIVQFGGQTPLKLARDLENAGVPIIGTAPDSIDLAEDRDRFQRLVTRLELSQPPNRTARTAAEAVRLADEIGYPLVVRPSYVLGGRAMEVVFSETDLVDYIENAVRVSNESPVLLDRFLEEAVEVDVDAVSDGHDVVIGGVMEHVEQAGVHSGDSGCSLPPNTLSDAVQAEIRRQMVALARELHVVGLMNAQFAVRGEEIFLIEVNPRASRTVPFVSKAVGLPLAKIATRCMAGQSLAEQGLTEERLPLYYSVKESVFPFAKFPGVDPILGPEMKSTGEVMGVGLSFGEAYAKAQLASGMTLPKTGRAFISVRDPDKDAAVELARLLVERGFDLVATRGTAQALEEAGVPVAAVNKVREGRPHIVDMIKNEEINLIVNTTEGKKAIRESHSIRSEAVAHKVAYYTTIAAGRATCLAMDYLEAAEPKRLQELHQEYEACRGHR